MHVSNQIAAFYGIEKSENLLGNSSSQMMVVMCWHAQR